MKISLITLSLNSEQNILRTLNSVKSQRNNKIEYLIFDGASKDKTVDLIKKFKPKKSIFISKKDRGMYFALNEAIKKSTGDVIGILHSDDIFYNKNIINNVLKTFNKTGANIIYGDIKYVNSNLKVFRNWTANSKKFANKILLSSDYLRIIKTGWMPPHTGFFFKKELILRRKLFNTKYSISSDYDFMIRLILNPKSKVYYLPKYIALMQLGGKSTLLGNIIKKSCEDYKIIKNNNIGGLFTLFLKNARKIKQFFRIFD
tara:strand:- start:2 stop:778 length:777 start_codon:yes stop_codon:yes gene_type:complete